MKTDDVSGGRITQALIRDRSLRVRSSRDRKMGLTKKVLPRVSSSLTFARSLREAHEFPSRTGQARRVAGRCGSVPTPSDPKR
jgi:hypothetical protein